MSNEADHYTPEARSNIKQLLRGVDPFKNDVALGGLLLGPIVQWFGGVFLNEIEELLRENDSPYYLVAVPTHQAKKGPLVDAYLPQTGQEKHPFALAICVGQGEVERINKKFELDYSEETNNIRLTQTGFLMPPGQNVVRLN